VVYTYILISTSQDKNENITKIILPSFSLLDLGYILKPAFYPHSKTASRTQINLRHDEEKDEEEENGDAEKEEEEEVEEEEKGTNEDEYKHCFYI
jgi:hypothetical protein